MKKEWSNWSGTIRFVPESIEEPRNEGELVDIVNRARDRAMTVRPVGMGHSSSPLVATSGVLVSPEHFQGIIDYDPARYTAIVGAGWRLRETAAALAEKGLSFENFGDVDYQSVAGAFGTGTHGSGRHLNNLSYHMVGGRLVTAEGQILDFDIESDPDLVRAARVSLGALGIFTRFTLRLGPEVRVKRRYWCTHVDECLEYLGPLTDRNRSFDFYWYPRSDLVQMRTLTESDETPFSTPGATLRNEVEDWLPAAVPRDRELKYHEMEYAFSQKSGQECFREVRERIKQRHRRSVCWRVLYRTVGGDDTFLSPAFGRDTVTITIHQNVTLPYWDYFSDIEPIFQAYGGRPHWGKKHMMKYTGLKSLYPMMDNFLLIRQNLDPQGIFLNDHLCDILGAQKSIGPDRESAAASFHKESA